MKTKTKQQILSSLTRNAKWWNKERPDPRFELGEIYKIKLHRKDQSGIREGVCVYSVKNHMVQIESFDGDSRLYIYPNDKFELIDD